MRYILWCSWLVSVFAFGQTEYDFSRHLRLPEGLGSARGAAMPGAIVVMGGDLQAAKVNPAGLGLYNRTVLAGTFGLYGTTLNSPAIHDSARGPRPEFSDVGLVIPLGAPIGPDARRGPWIVAVTWHKSVHHLTGAEIPTNGSMIARWKEIMDGYAPSAFYRSSPFALSLEEGLWTISDSTLWKYNPVLSPDSSQGSTYRFRGNQSRSVLDFAFGRQFAPWLFAGATLQIPFDIARNQETSRETFRNGGMSPKAIEYEEYTESKGSGLRMGAGLIVRPTCFLRIGVSYYSPAWLHVKDSISAVLRTGTQPPTGDFLVDTPVNHAAALWDYHVFLPSEFRLSVGLIDGGWGAVTAGLMTTRYGGIYFKAGDYPDPIFDTLNQQAAAMAQRHYQFSLSGELKQGPWRLRGGTRWDAQWQHWTQAGIGIGFHTPRWYADAAAYLTWQPQNRFTPFEGWNDGTLFSAIEGSRTTQGFSLTAGLRW